jgi:hypothetical protein
MPKFVCQYTIVTQSNEHIVARWLSYRVHGTLGRVARDTRQGVEAFNEQLCAEAEGVEDPIALLGIELIGLVTCAAQRNASGVCPTVAARLLWSQHSPGCGGFTMRSTQTCPGRLEQRPTETHLYTASIASGAKLWSSM